MGSDQTPLRLPVIDFSEFEGLKPDTLAWNSVKAKVQKALREYGCFEASSFTQIPSELRNSVFTSLDQLFDLPLHTKLRNSSAKGFHGYVGQYPILPLYESMGIEHAPIPEKALAFTNLMWPQHGNPNFCKTIQAFSEQLSELDQMIRRMVLESLGLENYLVEHMESTNYLLRVMKYKGPETTDTKLGLNAHTDKNIVTILHQNDVDGLEVQTRDGEWIKFQSSAPDSFIVMIGDSFHAWTNGQLYSPHHRVMMSGNQARFSLGLFSVPKAGYIIKAPDELVDEEHPLLFNPFDHVEFLAYYSTEAGRKDPCALKTYCGV